ncbi:MAG: 2-C-methyl-D-erythritol 2,4-cyclodiphosphate synthase, partial [Thermodesulfobacteriota bacterium]
FDIHKLVSGRKLKLCGVEIPFEKGLLGHSDGDVGLHALIDAMLSASGLPDIGTLFPDRDPQYKNIESIKLLKKTFEFVEKQGFKVSQVDLTFICDEPKLSPFYEKMKKLLSENLKLAPSEIGIKARTTEGLIKDLKEEAIACLCLVVLNKHES